MKCFWSVKQKGQKWVLVACQSKVLIKALIQNNIDINYISPQLWLLMKWANLKGKWHSKSLFYICLAVGNSLELVDNTPTEDVSEDDKSAAPIKRTIKSSAKVQVVSTVYVYTSTHIILIIMNFPLAYLMRTVRLSLFSMLKITKSICFLNDMCLDLLLRVHNGASSIFPW